MSQGSNKNKGKPSIRREARKGMNPLPIVGTCLTIEKPFFRLTRDPRPEEIRPHGVLKEALLLIERKWDEEKNEIYTNDQMKSIRQDLIVQRIRDELAVEAYEFHARVCLLTNNMNEFNQCQSVLHELYNENKECKHYFEFVAYRLLYDSIVNNHTDLAFHLKLLCFSPREGCIRHAFDVITTIRNYNYPRFCMLLETAPNLNGMLMKLYLPVMQRHMLQLLLLASYPSIRVESLEVFLEKSMKL